MVRVRKVVSFLQKRKDIDSIGKYDKVRLEHELFFNTWLCESFAVTLLKRPLFCPYVSVYQRPQSINEKQKEEKRHQEIRDLIEKAIEKRYIGMTHLKDGFYITRKGREFLKPVRFVEESAREYGFMASIITTMAATALVSIGGTIVVLFSGTT